MSIPSEAYDMTHPRAAVAWGVVVLLAGVVCGQARGAKLVEARTVDEQHVDVFRLLVGTGSANGHKAGEESCGNRGRKMLEGRLHHGVSLRPIIAKALESRGCASPMGTASDCGTRDTQEPGVAEPNHFLLWVEGKGYYQGRDCGMANLRLLSV